MKEKNKESKNKQFRKGFTLLELLVVVLIIGILAAVALPQYQIVVDKAEFTKYQTMVASLRNAYDDYVLVQNKGPKKFEDLALSLPSSFNNIGINSDYATCISDDNMWCCIRDFYNNGHGTNAWSGEIYCGKKDENFSIVYEERLYYSTGITANRAGKCLAKAGNRRAIRLCKTIGISMESGIALVDPVTGNSTGGVYNRYTLR